MSKKRIRQLCTVLFTLFILMAIWFAFHLALTVKEYKRGDEDLQEILQLRDGMESSELIPEEVLSRMDEASARAAREENAVVSLESYNKMKKWNEDLIGWIKINGTTVDYPVMQTPAEPDFYLHRGFDKEYSAYGMIYMDAGCRLDEECPNYLIYGHHMKNGSMFASLEEYASQDYWKAHPVIEFDSLEDTGEYEVFGVVRLDADELSPDFTTMLAARTKADYEALMDYIKTNTLYDTGVAAEWPNQLITLTTCEYSHKNGRFLVFAREK